jgi:hypothetical protein
VREPTLSGVARAYEIKRTPELQQSYVKERGFEDTTLSMWLINGPYHPFWSWWSVFVMALRDVPGAPPFNKQYPEAEYEIVCVSLNPEGEPGRPKLPDPDKIEAGDIQGGMPGFLVPPDWTVQFHKVTDAQAVKICEMAVRAIVAGQSCDSDFRQWWKGSITKTVEHFVLGVHE